MPINYVYGTGGNDWIDIAYNDPVTNGIDYVFGYEGHDWIFGLDGADLLFGMQGNDHLFGGGMDDTLKGGGGADDLWGGPNIDTAAYDDSPAGVTVSLLSGSGSGGDAAGDQLDSIENLRGSFYADTLLGNNEVNVLHGLNGSDSLKGYGGTDTLWGGADNDFLYGLNEADTLYGEGGHDTLNGGAGADTMYGGPGNDIYYVDDPVDIVDLPTDTVHESAGQGFDVVRTSTSWAMTPGSDIERLETTDATATTYMQLLGNASGNEIIGNDGDNVIFGGGGADQMTGNAGDDTYYVDNAGDSVDEAGGEGLDWVRTSVSWTLTPGADVEMLHALDPFGLDPLMLTGNETGNEIIGNDGSNTINGGEGDDDLTGRGEEDSFLFNTALDDEMVADAETNIDTITDFDVADDTILLAQTIFSSDLLANNSVAGSQFVIGAAALDANHRIIYNDATGAVYYDSDGVGGAAQIQFATLSAGLALTNFDFLVVAVY
jgi:Ca2+-binding RTX toxin-like protein